MRISVGAVAAIAAFLLAACQSAVDPAAEGSSSTAAAGRDAEPGAYASAGAAARREPNGGGPVFLPTDDERAFAAEIAGDLRGARYMEQNCNPATFPGWERLPLIQCDYTTTNRADGSTRSASVIMLNPSAEQVAQWIFSACRSIGKDTARCRNGLFYGVKNASGDDYDLLGVLRASGGQFAVAGVVLEDQMPRDGFYETYPFRNGVTVELAGVPYRATRQLTDVEIAASLAPETAITAVKTYARIISTTPAQYRANGGTADVGTNQSRTETWPATVGALYRAAWDSPNNELITALARANAAIL